ncbi:MAG: hypothetical protein K6A30_01700 [Lachnospiraceae bacterium]|nr:hypothetical protein [Lachnospiraceae bacterium]
MSQVILCPVMMAKKPYHLKSIDLYFYSFEEIVYYYYHHEILIDQSLMNEEFATWVKEELDQPVIASKLHQLIAGKSTITMFLEAILSSVNTLEEEEKQEFLSRIAGMEDKNQLERRKVLADQLMEREKYEAAIVEYRRIIEGRENTVRQPELFAHVWHNLGCAYGRLMLLEQAMECFKTSYGYAQLPETLDAVRFLLKLTDADEKSTSVEEDQYLNLLENNDSEKREIRHRQLEQRMKEYLRSTN